MTVAKETDNRLLLTVPEAARLLRISRNLAYELVAKGELPAVRLGRVIRVPRRSLEDWITRNAGPRLDPPDGGSSPLHQQEPELL
jgi:excisionase family DNA binding protein